MSTKIASSEIKLATTGDMVITMPQGNLSCEHGVNTVEPPILVIKSRIKIVSLNYIS